MFVLFSNPFWSYNNKTFCFVFLTNKRRQYVLTYLLLLLLLLFVIFDSYYSDCDQFFFCGLHMVDKIIIMHQYMPLMMMMTWWIFSNRKPVESGTVVVACFVCWCWYDRSLIWLQKKHTNSTYCQMTVVVVVVVLDYIYSNNLPINKCDVFFGGYIHHKGIYTITNQ